MNKPYVLCHFHRLRQFASHCSKRSSFVLLRRQRHSLPGTVEYGNPFPISPEGKSGMSDVSPLSGISGLSFDSTLLSPVLFFCLVLFLFLTYLLSACWSILLNFFQKILPRFFIKTKAFLYGPCSAARGSKLGSGMYNMLPYGTGICCYAFIYIFFIAPVHSFFCYTCLKSGFNESTKWSRYSMS